MTARRRFFVPEVVQTSATDCGPACLTSLLEGHGIRASYGRLREACRTDVDGSSIDTLEQIAVDLGLDARQVMVPKEHLLHTGLLPAIVVVRQPSGMTHFVVAWRLHPGCVQIMDPATGRRWSSPEPFLDEVYTHEFELDAMAWCEWAGSDDFLLGVHRRLRQLGLGPAQADDAIRQCRSPAGWRPPAALDAAARLVAALMRDGALRTRRESRRLLLALFARARDEANEPTAVIPAEFWTARKREPGSTTVQLRGAVLVSIARPAAPAPGADLPARAPLAAGLARALAEPLQRPGRQLLALLRSEGLLAPGLLVALLALAAGGVLVEALLFRALFAIGSELAVAEQRLAGLAMLLAFAALLLALEWPIWSRTLALGRRLECRLRLQLLDKLTRVHDRYFQSRLVSDMAERCHRLHELRAVPELGAELLRAVFGLLATTAGIVWLAPHVAPLALAGAALCIAVPLLAQPLLGEGDLRLRNHSGAILRFHLDALLGIVPLRAHAAGRALRGEHQRLIGLWSRAGMRLQRRVVGVEAVQSVTGIALAVLLLGVHGARDPNGAGALLMVYWALSLPVFGQQIGLCAQRYPTQRSTTLRFLELLGTPDAGGAAPATQPTATTPDHSQVNGSHGGTVHRPAVHGPVAIRLDHVTVVAAGHPVLDGVNLDIAAGSHTAIVGPSGAGKSSLVGLLLGWHEPACGQVLVDGAPLDHRTLERLRQHTAWVDPGVQLWNRSLLDNLCYGSDSAVPSGVGVCIERSGVATLLNALPDGLQSSLGEGGALVSGGEGQRVRLARATLRRGTRLAVLDEPFRGLSREVRKDLLDHARELWHGTTLLCVTHDIEAALGFDRVLVVEGGRVVEDGDPRLLQQQASRYRAHLEAERSMRATAWADPSWRRLRLEHGRLRPAAPEALA